MCGIAAVTGSGWEAKAVVRDMLLRMAYRGNRAPEWDEVRTGSLGCVRLAIVDEAGGRQPMENETGDLTCVFNGEIYNWRKLADELTARGHEFRTRCDTEVVVHGFEEWGTDLFARMEGMYALVVFDDRLGDGRVVAARDPFGIKPLYWGLREDGRAVFGSEIRVVQQAGVSDVRSTPPGGRVENFSGEFRATDRELFPTPPPLRGVELATAATEVRRLLREAVRAMMPPDQPVAVLCGGGIDSTAVLYEAARTGQPVTAFVIGTEDAPDVRAVSALHEYLLGCGDEDGEYVKIDFQHVRVDPDDILRSIPEVIETIESFEPNHIRGGTLSYALARAVHGKGIKVALCGEGADELFAGYPEFAECLRAPEPDAALRKRADQFVRELHKTQLKRVDRTNMAWSVEVRVPFLYGPLASYALSLPICTKLWGNGEGGLVAKRVLREAYRGIDPLRHIVDRPKVVLSAGAGMGDNGPGGPFHELGERGVSHAELVYLRAKHPEFQLRTREEALYFSYFKSLFGPLPLAAKRPLVNRLPTPE